MTVKAVVTFAGARDHYQLPLALAEGDMLDSLITDLYLPLDTAWFNGIARGRLAQLSEKRYCKGIRSQQAQIVPTALGAALAGSIYRKAIQRLNRYKDSQLSEAARRYAIRHQSAIFTYSYYARQAFARPWDDLPYRFLFQVHPHTFGARVLLREELDRIPEAAASLSREYELLLSESEFEDFDHEMRNANGWVVASSFTAKMLSAQGLPLEKLHVVPYGIDLTQFASRAAAPAPTEPFTVIFVGQLVQRKGLAYLLEALRLLKTKSIRLMLCGRGFVDENLLASYADVPKEIHIGLPYPELLRLLRSSDVFVFPSLVEGFGLVLLEAMACGVPIIASTNTAAPDLIEEGKQGFIVPIRSPQAIAERLEWALNHRTELAAMGEAAAERARMFTWERFRQQIRQAYREMLEEVDGK